MGWSDAYVIGIKRASFEQLYNGWLDVDKGRFTDQFMRVNPVNFKRLWMTSSNGVNEGVDNHMSITITKRNLDDLIILAATGGFGIKEQGLAGIVQSVVLLEFFENSNNCVLGGFLTHERLACM